MIATVLLVRFVRSEVGYDEIGRVFMLGLFTALRVIVLIALASLVWVPIGVWIGLRPTMTQRLQPAVVFLAAFPANLVFRSRCRELSPGTLTRKSGSRR